MGQTAEFIARTRQAFVRYEAGFEISLSTFLRLITLYGETPAEFFARPEAGAVVEKLIQEAALYKAVIPDNTKHRRNT